MVKVDKCTDRRTAVENKGITSRQTAQGGNTGARARAKGRGKPSKGRKMYDGGDGSPLTRYQTAHKGAKNDGGGKVDK